MRRLFERVWNGGDLSAIEDLVDDQFTNFSARQLGGHASIRHIATAWRTAFPDLHSDTQEEIIHDDQVVLRVIARGTHRADSRRESARPGSWGPCRPPAGPPRPTRYTSTASRAARSLRIPR
jgi:hypothetical protein